MLIVGVLFSGSDVEIAQWDGGSEQGCLGFRLARPDGPDPLRVVQEKRLDRVSPWWDLARGDTPALLVCASRSLRRTQSFRNKNHLSLVVWNELEEHPGKHVARFLERPI